jgi:hypothetical protein
LERIMDETSEKLRITQVRGAAKFGGGASGVDPS